MNNIFSQIQGALDQIAHGWTTPQKATALASCVIAIRPEVSVEIGVWAGKGLISLALAHKHIGKGIVYGVDPYSPAESSDGQVSPADRDWWGSQNHDQMYHFAQSNILKYGLGNMCRLIRKKSDDFEVPENIGVLVVDGNHGDQSIRDMQRYAPKVKAGGFLFADDLHWQGKSVQRAIQLLPDMGFVELWRVEKDGDNYAVFQRVK
jgi:predicted O-methyltransferase YrrM